MASVWAELRRRNVVKVAVAYAIVGWLLVEVASVVLPSRNFRRRKMPAYGCDFNRSMQTFSARFDHPPWLVPSHSKA